MISRREWIRITAGAAAAVTLGGCGGNTGGSNDASARGAASAAGTQSGEMILPDDSRKRRADPCDWARRALDLGQCRPRGVGRSPCGAERPGRGGRGRGPGLRHSVRIRRRRFRDARGRMGPGGRDRGQHLLGHEGERRGPGWEQGRSARRSGADRALLRPAADQRHRPEPGPQHG